SVFARVAPLICIVPVHVPPPACGAAVTVMLPKNCDSGALPDTCPENVACQPDHEGSVKRMVPSTFRSDWRIVALIRVGKHRLLFSGPSHGPNKSTAPRLSENEGLSVWADLRHRVRPRPAISPFCTGLFWHDPRSHPLRADRFASAHDRADSTT